jgi:hypothetical protein
MITAKKRRKKRAELPKIMCSGGIKRKDQTSQSSDEVQTTENNMLKKHQTERSNMEEKRRVGTTWLRSRVLLSFMLSESRLSENKISGLPLSLPKIGPMQWPA